MKNNIFLSNQLRIACFILIYSALALSSLRAQDLPENDPDADYGLVLFMRGKEIAGSVKGFNAIIDEQWVCTLKSRYYSMHKLSPGQHFFKAQYGGKKGKKKAEVVQIEVEAGKTYYINLVVHNNYWWSDVTPREITRNSALRLFKDDEIKLAPDCGDFKRTPSSS